MRTETNLASQERHKQHLYILMIIIVGLLHFPDSPGLGEFE